MAWIEVLVDVNYPATRSTMMKRSGLKTKGGGNAIKRPRKKAVKKEPVKKNVVKKANNLRKK